MKNGELFSLYNGLNKLGNLKGIKFIYAINKNKRIVEPEIKTIQDSLRKECPKYYEYMDEQQKLVNKINLESDDKKKKALIKNLDNLRDTNKEVIEEFKKKDKEIADIETKIKLHKIKLSDVPEDITEEQMNGIYSIIEEK